MAAPLQSEDQGVAGEAKSVCSVHCTYTPEGLGTNVLVAYL